MIRIYDAHNYFRILLDGGRTVREIYTDMFLQQDVTIVVWDGVGANKRRRAIYPAYKMNRPPVVSSTFENFKFIERLLVHTDVIQVRVPEWEADDVIATLSQRYASSGSQVGIFSNDYDFAQLTDKYPSNIFCGAKSKDHVPSEYIRTFKASVGDTSDNISGIKGFGKVGWAKANKPLLRNFLRGEAESYPFESQSVSQWVRDNQEVIRALWEIVGFYDVDMKLINQHMSKGGKDYPTANDHLERFFL